MFSRPVSESMTTGVATVSLDAMLPLVAGELDRHRVSAVAVVDASGAIVGVISRTDLLRIGRIQAGSHRKAAAITLPEKRAGDLIRERTRTPIVVGAGASLREAARAMCEHRVHRVFVIDNARLVGVVSTLDLMTAVSQARVAGPLSEIMSTPVFSVNAHQPISVAIERLEHARVTGLLVQADDWPIGVFTQLEAMQARDLPRDTLIEDVYDPSMLCLPDETKIYRAAAQAHRLEVRRIIPCRDREAVGIVTGFDFAKLVAA
ncbi:MAG: CBS domain-containing protein [Kofleriaceae bacterium]